jgi:hypothetical protein
VGANNGQKHTCGLSLLISKGPGPEQEIPTLH